jgi:ATP-binding cassette, subfamily F, member 2
MVLVSHDFRLINQVAEEIWICENGTVTKWKGNILDYKDHLKKKITKEEAERKKK